MERLPQEIYDEIGALLQDPHPALATVSRRWQMAVERRTFRHITLKSTDLDRFEEIVRSNRRQYVCTINYVIILPGYSDRGQFERDDDRRANDKVFTSAIHRLFHLLKSWDSSKDGYIQLGLRDIYSNADHDFLRRSSPAYNAGCYLHVHRDARNSYIADLWSWRYRYSYLRLLHPSQLPVVPVIESFITYPMTRNMCDRVPIDMAARLPSLRVCSWRMNQWEIPYISLRRTHRRDLAQAVAEVLPRSSALQSLTLNMNSLFFWSPNFSVGTLDPVNSTFDTLSNALRTATGGISTLTKLSIRGTIDESFLWPASTHGSSEPYWQNLEHLEIHFDVRRPSGGSYFWDPQLEVSVPSEAEMPPGYGSSELEDVIASAYFSPKEHLGRSERVRRVVPDDSSIEPLMQAFGRACLQLPKLKSAQLSTTIPASVGLDNDNFLEGRSPWGVWYFSLCPAREKSVWIQNSTKTFTRDGYFGM